MEKLSVVVRIAFRNLFASRLKSAIVGGIILVGAVLIVVGVSFVGSMTEGMSRSVIGSAAGDLQIYAPKYADGGGDELAIWGSMNEPDLGAIDDFSKLKPIVEKIPNVKSVVPMGISSALVTSGNTIDLALGDLRDAERKHLAGDQSPEVMSTIEGEKAHVKHIVEVLQGDLKNRAEISVESGQEEKDTLAKAGDPAFWQSFDQDPYAHLEFLENKLAPLAADADLLYLRYIGTDLGAFQRSFDRMKIVDGTPVPPGARGFLFAKNFYEDRVKLKSAHRLDQIQEAMDTNHRKIAGDAELQRLIKQNQTQTREIVLQLDDVKAKQMVQRLQKLTGSQDTDLDKLLASFFDMNDADFHERYKAFYDQLAPLLDLYRIRIGDTLTIKSFTKSGYVKSVNLKVYGTFEFKGLEKSALAGSLNLMDLNSFRDLYGFLTPEREKEVKAIEKQAGMVHVDRDKAEDELFGSGPPAATPPDTGRTIEAQATPGVVTEKSSPAQQALHDKEVQGRVFTQAQIDQGQILNAAVFLKNPKLSRQTAKEIEDAGRAAGMNLKVADWQSASGMIGKMVLLFWAILVVIITIIFLVAAIIVNVALLTATLERIREFGTLRAIGAQKPFVLGMVVVEAIVLGVVFGGLGAALGAGVVAWVHSHGIPATADIMYFLFSGPRFQPVISTTSLVVAVVAMFAISAIASLIPAYMATRVPPVRAMQAED